LDLTPLKVRFARNNRGLPRIIPSHHRVSIRKGDKVIITFWLSLFSLYRVLDYPYKFSVSSIVDPTKATDLEAFRLEFTSYLTYIFVPTLGGLYPTEWLKRVLGKRSSNLYWGELLRMKFY